MAHASDKSYPGEKFFLKAAVWCLRMKEMFSAQLGKNERQHKEFLYKEQLNKSRLGKKLKLLNPELSEKQQVKNFYLKKYSIALLVLFVGNLLSLCVAVSSQTGGLLKEGGYINRNSYGEGNVELVLSAQIEGKEAEEIFYIVEEQKFKEEEINLLYKEASELLLSLILGENNSLDEVTKNLNLVSAIEGYPFNISWEGSSYSLIHTDGSIQNEELADPEVVTLKACFKYDELEFEEVFPVQICPAELTDKELLIKSIEDALEEQNQSSRTDETMVLPNKIGMENVTWREVIQDSSGYLFLLICVASVVVFISQNKEVEENLKKRNRELLLDYPEVINKLTLYMGAGMTIRNAFMKMGEDYKKNETSNRKRYVYEEILLLCHELQSGISETEVYAHLGKRCSLQQYMKLSALLSQNIRKGSNNLLLMMRQEVADAFEERKNTAKKLGEEAGTKLLIPMMMMLCIVMVIIMIPAYFSFSA
ncbi:MAG: type II secretion system F family protein [Lachnospiraceae bacterium]|nr:type II secretion system F family protein [Lachnospiraceae bacterium]